MDFLHVDILTEELRMPKRLLGEVAAIAIEQGQTFRLEDFDGKMLNELEGLARGADARDCPPASRAALNPEHVARVAESAKAALAFARSRNPAIRCLTTRGTVLTSSIFTVEEDVDKDGLTRNDDRILTTCLSLCRSNKDQANAEKKILFFSEHNTVDPEFVKEDNPLPKFIKGDLEAIFH
ncbi:telomerase-binding protein est1a [Lasius niger]|uniref:Telomerase-binding protein est1a n=1 Tax=Lasius niger TaxID=67767 RepID=A0A0J7KY07_LASNI|nr:telomerase-binding protein est1a [Lasius niger]